MSYSDAPEDGPKETSSVSQNICMFLLTGEGISRWKYIKLNVHAFSLPNKDVTLSTKGTCE